MNRLSITRLPTWGKTEFWFACFLITVIFAEMLAVFVLSRQQGLLIAEFFASAGGLAFKAISDGYGWLYKMVGPVLYPLIGLTVAEAIAMVKLVGHCRRGSEPDAINRYYKVLEIVESVGPGFGFLGTCLSLIETMYNIDPKLDQVAMIKVLLDYSSSAFGSTVYGLVLAISAHLCTQIFKHFVFPENRNSQMSAVISGRLGENSASLPEAFKED